MRNLALATGKSNEELWKSSPYECAEITQLEDSMRTNRSRIEVLWRQHPSVWHMDYKLSDFTERINQLTSNANPDLDVLTLVCLFVRAATDRVALEKLNWASPAVEQQIETLVCAVRRARTYVESRRNCFNPEDEETRALYEQHIVGKLSVLESLTSRDASKRPEFVRTLLPGKRKW